MDGPTFVAMCHRLHEFQELRLRFTNNGKSGLARLWGARSRHPLLAFARNEEVVIMAILKSGDWGCERNRSIEVCGLRTLDEDFLGPLARDIESVTAPEHPASGIAVKRQKSRLEALTSLRHTILPEANEAAEEWGLTVSFGFMEPNDLTVALFQIKQGDKALHTVGLDGWSGCLVESWDFESPATGQKITRRYTDPQQLIDLLNRKIEDVVESLTSA